MGHGRSRASEQPRFWTLPSLPPLARPLTRPFSVLVSSSVSLSPSLPPSLRGLPLFSSSLHEENDRTWHYWGATRSESESQPQYVPPSLCLSVLLRPRTCKHSQSIYMKAFILRVCEREKRKRQREGEVTSMVCNCRYDGVCIFATHPVLR